MQGPHIRLSEMGSVRLTKLEEVFYFGCCQAAAAYVWSNEWPLADMKHRPQKQTIEPQRALGAKSMTSSTFNDIPP